MEKGTRRQDMDNEAKEKAAALAGEAKKKAAGIWQKIAGLWKSGTKGKVICIVGVLAIVWAIGACGDDEGGGGGGNGSGGGWRYTGKYFLEVFQGFPNDEGTVYWNNGWVKVVQATKKGNLASCGSSGRVVWVETKRRYEDGESLDSGYYIRRGSMEYETAFGAEKQVARYVEVTDKGILAKIQKQIEEEKAAAEKAKREAKARRKAEEEAQEAKKEAAREAVVKALAVAGSRAGETKTITLPGGVKMEMAWCPAGRFTTGSSDGWPVHEVALTKGFWMAKTEVTQAQWKSVMGYNRSWHEGDNLPKEEATWNDCQEFCKKTGLSLPTEAEWEYACRAGTTGDYGGTGTLDDMGWYGGNSGVKTHPVGQKQPNAWGLFDMHGNVWEWCADWYGDYPNGPVTDPTGAGSGDYRVIRGGSYMDNASNCRSANRNRWSDPGRPHQLIGFRPIARQD